MTDSLTLTFAEIDFLLRSGEQGFVDVRLQLGIDPAADSGAAVVRAGAASLLARGLCALEGETVVPGAEVVAVAAALTTATEGTRALGWVDGRMVLLHLFCGPVGRVVLLPGAFGQFVVMGLDPELTVGDQVARFVDSCLGDAVDSTVVIQSKAAEGTVGIAVVRDSGGAWFVSDSAGDPDSAMPSTRDQVVARIRELVPVGAG